MTSDKTDPDQDQAAVEYDAWFTAKVIRALADPRPSIPHEEAMARSRATIRAVAERRRRDV